MMQGGEEEGEGRARGGGVPLLDLPGGAGAGGVGGSRSGRGGGRGGESFREGEDEFVPDFSAKSFSAQGFKLGADTRDQAIKSKSMLR